MGVDGWSVIRFDRCANLIRDTVRPSDVSDLPYIGLEHIVENQLALVGYGLAEQVTSIKSRFKKGDILFGKLRPYFRKVVLAPFDGVCSTDIWVVRRKQGTDQRYLFYWMASHEFIEESTRASEGTRMPRAKWEFVGRIEKPIPPLPTQRAIAHILGTLDDKIELNRQMNKTLEEMAQALFKSWFIDFDPVRRNAARARNQPSPLTPLPEVEGKRLDGDKEYGTAFDSLFPDSFEDSELGEIPKGWKVGALSVLASLQTKTIQPGKQPDVLWEHYSIPAYDEGQHPKRELGETIKSGKFAVPLNSILVSKLNPQFPRIWLPWVSDADLAICSTEFMPYVPQKASWRPFLYEMMKSQPIQEAIQAHVTGSTGSRQRARPSEIAELTVLVPLPIIIEKFSHVVASFHNKFILNLRQNRRLVGLRDALLPKLLGGEIVLPAAAIIAREVL